MPAWLDKIDVAFFFIINKTLANPVFDVVMPFLTDKHNFYIPILLTWLALIVIGGKKGRVSAVLIIFVILLSDQASSSWVKPMVGRIRPCNTLDAVRLLVNCTNAFSFTSSHAANMFASAFLFSRFYPRARVYLFSFAAAVAYSRVYVGVHYPLDAIGGALLGMLSAWLVILAYENLADRYYPGLLVKEAV